MSDKADKIIESERLYIYPNDIRPGETMKRYILNITGIDDSFEDGHAIIHTTHEDEYIAPGYIKIYHKVPKDTKAQKDGAAS